MKKTIHGSFTLSVFSFITALLLYSLSQYSAQAAPTTVMLIPAGATWKYLDNGSDQGSGWQPVGFDDSGWAGGAAQLGYGEGDEATVVSFGPDSNDKYITTYFRHTFNVTNPASVTGLTVHLQRDDGAVVYLNGTEVVRDNMPAGVIGYLTTASSTVSSGDEDAFWETAVSPAHLTTGNNTLAVEIHQRSSASSDVSFDLSLEATINDNQAPTIPVNLVATATTAYDITLGWAASTDDFGVTGYEIYRDGNLVGTSPTTSYVDAGLMPETAYSYTVRAYDDSGNTSASSASIAPTTDAVGSTVRFGVIGDYGEAGTPEADVAALINSWHPDFIATVGDNNYSDGEASTIDPNIGQYFQAHIGSYTGSYGSGSQINRFFPSLGNHDWHGLSCTGSNCTGPYFDYFDLPNNERYYTQTWGEVELFIIDSDSDEPDGISSGSIQGQWLQAQLAASTATWKLVILHHAPYSSANHGSNVTLQWPYQAWGADAVLAGHDHSYERFLIGGFPYFVNGLGGRSLYTIGAPEPGSVVRYDDDYGAMIVEADSTELTFQFLNRTGTVIDCYTIGGGNPSVVPLSIAQLGAADAHLSWEIAAANPGYEVHHSTTPYFGLGDGTLLSASPLVGASSYNDGNVIGNPATNHFYAVRSLNCGGGMTADSAQVGEFDFAIVPGS